MREFSADPRLQLDAEDDQAREQRQAESEGFALKRANSGRVDLDNLIAAALAGDIPRSRELKSWEPAKLNPVHIEIIMMRASGIKQRTIAQFLGLTDSTVSIVLGHPDAQYIMARVLGNAAHEVADVSERFKLMAPEALETVAEVMRFGKEQNRLKAAFSILDRAGYGAEQKTKITHEVNVPTESINLLSDAIREAGQAIEADYVIVGGGAEVQVSAPEHPPHAIEKVG